MSEVSPGLREVKSCPVAVGRDGVKRFPWRTGMIFARG